MSLRGSSPITHIEAEHLKAAAPSGQPIAELIIATVGKLGENLAVRRGATLVCVGYGVQDPIWISLDVEVALTYTHHHMRLACGFSYISDLLLFYFLYTGGFARASRQLFTRCSAPE